jgi:hypothetical protein
MNDTDVEDNAGSTTTTTAPTTTTTGKDQGDHENQDRNTEQDGEFEGDN